MVEDATIGAYQKKVGESTIEANQALSCAMAPSVKMDGAALQLQREAQAATATVESRQLGRAATTPQDHTQARWNSEEYVLVLVLLERAPPTPGRCVAPVFGDMQLTPQEQRASHPNAGGPWRNM